MGPIEALKLALAKEVEAIDLYERFSAEYPTAKDIFLFLANEGQKHKQMIEKQIYELSK